MKNSKFTIHFCLGIFLCYCLFAFAQTKPKPDAAATPTGGEDAESMLAFLLSDKTRNLHQWSAISQFHGLPSERVNAIEQTPDGVMWFATDAGLAKFDGRRVQSVSPENFASKRILALRTDASGALWIGTERGAYRYAENAFQSFPETENYSISSILPESSDIDGIFFVALDESKSKSTYMLASRNAEDVFAIDVNTQARPVIGNKIVGFKGSGDRMIKISVDVYDSDKNWWIGTPGEGVYLYRGKEEISHYTLENTAGGLRSNEILSIFVDRENVIWFGTTKGISRFDPNSPLSEQFADGTNSNFIRTIFQATNGKVFAGTQRGLFESAAVGDWRAVAGFERRQIYAIAENDPDKLLVGTSRGLFVYPSGEAVKTTISAAENAANNTEKQTPAGSIRAIQKFQNKIYLGVFGQGLARLDGGNYAPLADNPAETLNVTSMKTVGDRLWIGTAEAGAFFFDGQKFGTDAALENLKNKAIWSIETAAAGDIWFGTEKGLFLYRNGALSAINAGYDVRALAVDASGVWCATEKSGLVRFAEDAVFGWISSRFDIEQGLPSQKVFSIFRQSEDTFLIGTTRGIVRYKTPRTRPLLVPTRILSRRLHSPEELKSVIVLEYPQNTLTAEVSAINSRTFPEQFQYAFLLKDAKDRIVRQKFGADAQFLMDNLAAGDYALEIRGFDKNLIASDPLVFGFRIEKAPFPWITLALTVLLLFALIALVWAILSQRKIFQKSSELKTANRELNAARMDLANEAERERRRISRDLHDQTLADLRHLQLLADEIPGGGGAAENSQTIRREIENVSNEIRRICEDLSPSVLENIGFAAALEWALSNFAAHNRQGEAIEREFRGGDETAEENLRLSPAEQIQIYRIAQEVLSNISRHTSAKKITMTLRTDAENSFLLAIEDDGDGFDFENAARLNGRGLSNIKSRAQLIKAGFSFAKTEGGGTIFTLRK